MEKPSLSRLDHPTTDQDPNSLLPSIKSETSTTASIGPSSSDKQQEEVESQDEPENEDHVGWSRLIIVVIALILSIFMVCKTPAHGCAVLTQVFSRFHWTW